MVRDLLGMMNTLCQVSISTSIFICYELTVAMNKDSTHFGVCELHILMTWSSTSVLNIFITSIIDIFRQYSSDLTGFSTGTGGRNNRNAKLNVADPGNVARLVPTAAICSIFTTQD